MSQDTQQKREYLDYSGLTYYTKKVMSWFGILSTTEIDEIIAHVEAGDCDGCEYCTKKDEQTEK